MFSLVEFPLHKRKVLRGFSGVSTPNPQSSTRSFLRRKQAEARQTPTQHPFAEKAAPKNVVCVGNPKQPFGRKCVALNCDIRKPDSRSSGHGQRTLSDERKGVIHLAGTTTCRYVAVQTQNTSSPKYHDIGANFQRFRKVVLHRPITVTTSRLVTYATLRLPKRKYEK